MHLLLLRHGQPTRIEAPGPGGPPLTELGQRQALCLARRLQAEAPDLVISSHLTRAHQTAEPTAHSIAKDILIEPSVAEVDADGGVYVHIEDLRAEGGETWAAFLRDPIKMLGGNQAKFRKRVLEGFETILAQYSDAHQVAVFTHGFPINILLSHILGLDEITRFLPAHGSITRLAGRSINNLAILSVNETGHFPAGEL